MNNLTKTIFCANEQMDTLYDLSAAFNGDVVATCEGCGRVLKFPAGVTKDEFDGMVEEHKTANEGQVTQAAIENTLAELADPVKE